MLHRVWFGLGTIHLKYFEKKDALKVYEKSLKIKPDDLDAINNLGFTYNEMGEFDKAEELFSKGLKISPLHERMLQNRAKLYYDDLRDYEKSLLCSRDVSMKEIIKSTIADSCPVEPVEEK